MVFGIFMGSHFSRTPLKILRILEWLSLKIPKLHGFYRTKTVIFGYFHEKSFQYANFFIGISRWKSWKKFNKRGNQVFPRTSETPEKFDGIPMTCDFLQIQFEIFEARGVSSNNGLARSIRSRACLWSGWASGICQTDHSKCTGEICIG